MPQRAIDLGTKVHYLSCSPSGIICRGELRSHAAAMDWARSMSEGSNIVVVEDDASMRRAVERFLFAAGFHATSFGSAEALLANGMDADVVCLVIDVRLPGISGIELSQLLHGAGDRTPVIFVTAHDEPLVRQRAVALGCIAYLTKPFDGHQLVDAITHAPRYIRTRATD